MHTYIIHTYIHTCLLLLISMLWHRQTIFESKGDKLSSSAECRIRTWKSQDIYSPTDWMPTHKPIELSRIKQKLEVNSPSLWWASIQSTWLHCRLAFAPGSGDIHVCCCEFRCSGTGKRYSNLKELSYIHTYIHKEIQTHMHACIYACMHMRAYCMHASIHTCLLCYTIWIDWHMVFVLEQEGGSLITPMALTHPLSIPLTTGRGTGAETCGLDDVFPPDDLCSRPEALSLYIYIYTYIYMLFYMVLCSLVYQLCLALWR